jgi:hypothetical protein
MLDIRNGFCSTKLVVLHTSGRRMYGELSNRFHGLVGLLPGVKERLRVVPEAPFVGAGIILCQALARCRPCYGPQDF